ncbi:hypothetical protein FA95DRAFT_1594809 [Auriscalpium vulgare]|uniref:Uncharacterized protein n=1 Tax=Auriscalpium vulgare TaxID=40419 RepID=A0ACB8RYR6_9AGAM|nr:hypothetical protein FA95DRAFT_1594809 [Auriscalpium vulgare]
MSQPAYIHTLPIEVLSEIFSILFSLNGEIEDDSLHHPGYSLPAQTPSVATQIPRLVNHIVDDLMLGPAAPAAPTYPADDDTYEPSEAGDVPDHSEDESNVGLGPTFDEVLRSYDDDENPPPNWVALTQVCRRWRLASFRWRGFWAAVWAQPLPSRRWTKYALRHSRSFPVDVRAPSFMRLKPGQLTPSVHAQELSALSLALGDMRRVRSITMTYTRAPDEDREDVCIAPTMLVIDRLKRHAALLLESLWIEIPHKEMVDPETGEEYMAETLQLPTTLFNRNTPQKLRDLQLSGCGISGLSNLFQSPVLESLHIQGCDWTPLWTDWTTFRGAMLSLSGLRTLRLGELMLPRDISAHDDSTRAACLPHLELLEVEGSPQEITQLLRHIHIPDTAHMNLNVSLRADDIASGRLEKFMDAVASYFENDRAHDLVDPLPQFDALALYFGPPAAEDNPESSFIASFKVCETEARRCDIALRNLATDGPDDIPAFTLFEHGLDAVRRLPIFRTVKLIGSNTLPHWPGVTARFLLLLIGRELRLGVDMPGTYAKIYFDGEKVEIGDGLYSVANHQVISLE